MKKLVYCLSLMLLAGSLTSCSSKEKGSAGEENAKEQSGQQTVKGSVSRVDENTLNINISQSNVYGKTAEYLSIVPGTYTLSRKGDDLRLKLRLKLEKSLPDGSSVTYHPRVKLLDGDEAELESYSSILVLDNREKFQSFLKSEEGKEEDFLFVKTFLPEKSIKLYLDQTKQIQLEDLDVESDTERAEKEKEMDKALQDCKKVMDVSKSALDLLDNL